jgi:putative CocE/NonD family hydrolase
VEFNLPFLGLVAGLNAVNPLVGLVSGLGQPPKSPSGLPASLQRLLPTELQHAASLATSALPLIASLEGGGDQAYDEAYWAARNPVNVLAKVAAEQIPTFLVGGWFDLFQRGELLNFTGLQNAAASRPVTAPLLPGQPLSPRYQLMMGPWYHVTTGQGVDLPRIELEWFDTWLLGHDTPLAHTTTPLHLYELQAKKWIDSATWPVSSGSPTKYYLGSGRAGSGALSTNDGSLSTAVPTAPDGADTIMFTGLSSVCDRQTDQWSGGILALASSSLGVANPCDANDVSLGSGPGALTYTTAPLPTPQVLAGPIDASIYATANTTDTDLVATVEEVSPAGESVPLTSGALLGSFRAVDRANSWFAADGSPLLPYHP